MEPIDFYLRRLGPPTCIAICWLWEIVRPARPMARVNPTNVSFPDAVDRSRTPSSSRFRHGITNLATGLANAALVALAFTALMTGVAAWTKTRQWGLLNQWELPLHVRWPAIFLVLDGLIYLWHYANHRSRWLWRFHRAHHSDPYLSATTSVRFHAGEIALSAAAKTALVPLLGLQLSELAAYETLLAASTAFHHANVSLGKWDAVLRVLFVTPDIHKLHHSIDPRQTHSNFSTILSVWDRLAGTFQRPVHPETIEFGVADLKDTSSQGFVGIWTTPFRRPRTVSSDTPAPSQALKSTHNAGEISGSHRP